MARDGLYPVFAGAKKQGGLNYKLEKVPLPQSNGLNGGRKNN